MADSPTPGRLLEGRRVVVTGASRGLGRAFAVALAEQGARLVINGTDAARLAETQAAIDRAGGRAVSQLGSVADYQACAAVVGRCVQEFGGIDVLVNNAGTVRDRTLMRMTPEEFDEVIAVNLRGTWACSREAAVAMKEGGGHIINVISGSAFTGPVGQTNYAAAKAGVAAMMRCWVHELARYGIRCNSIWPLGLTDMTRVIVDRNRELAEKEGREPPSPRELGLGLPEEIAPIVVFLASDEASSLNGQVVSFNGRRLALWTHPREVHVEQRDDPFTLDDLRRDFFSTAGREPQTIYQAIRRV
jgi:NAD(P)-dependent dehydrogenase (short-subunit alcohol dehydrogenase family)